MTAKTFSTTPTIGIFLILSVSGIFLLFHLAGPNLKMLHEWLGLAFIVFALLHVVANWPLMKHYLEGGKLIAIAAILVSATVFALSPAPISEGGSPIRSLLIQVKRAPLSTVASLYEKDINVLVPWLQGQGFEVAGAETTLADLARSSGISEDKLLALIGKGWR